MFTQIHGAALMLGKDQPAAGKFRALMREAGDMTVRTQGTATAIFHPGSSVWMVHTTGSGMWRVRDHSGLRASSAALSRLMGGLETGCGQTAVCLAQHMSQVTHTLCAGVQRPRLPLYSVHTITCCGFLASCSVYPSSVRDRSEHHAARSQQMKVKGWVGIFVAYSRDPRFIVQLFWVRLFTVFLSPFMQIPGKHLKIGHDNSLWHPFQFVIQ
jgi:hypothetical protein